MCRRREPRGTSTSLGTTNTGQPALSADAVPVTESSMADGSSLFVFRSDKGDSASAVAMKNADQAVDQKTEVVLSNDSGSLHVDKLFIEGESTGYQFAVTK